MTAEEKKEAKRIYQKNYREQNKDRIKDLNKKWYNENKSLLIEKQKEYYINNRDRIIERTIKYEKLNKSKINIKKNKYRKERREKDSLYNLTHNIRSLISISFKEKGIRKDSKTSEILGCSFEEFKEHLESKFQSWMSWDNKALYNGTLNYGWDIDHIIPLSSATTEVELLKLNHFSNFQPLCSYTNRHIKRNIIS